MSDLLGNHIVGFSTRWLICENHSLELVAFQHLGLYDNHMSCSARKLVFGVSDQPPHKPACTVTEECLMLEIFDISRRLYMY